MAWSQGCDSDASSAKDAVIIGLWGFVGIGLNESFASFDKTEEHMRLLKAVWAFCSYLFWPQWGRRQGEEGG